MIELMQLFGVLCVATGLVWLFGPVALVAVGVLMVAVPEVVVSPRREAEEAERS